MTKHKARIFWLAKSEYWDDYDAGWVFNSLANLKETMAKTDDEYDIIKVREVLPKRRRKK